MTHGCYVAGADEEIYQIADNTLLYGNLQAEDIFDITGKKSSNGLR